VQTVIVHNHLTSRSYRDMMQIIEPGMSYITYLPERRDSINDYLSARTYIEPIVGQTARPKPDTRVFFSAELRRRFVLRDLLDGSSERFHPQNDRFVICEPAE